MKMQVLMLSIVAPSVISGTFRACYKFSKLLLVPSRKLETYFYKKKRVFLGGHLMIEIVV